MLVLYELCGMVDVMECCPTFTGFGGGYDGCVGDEGEVDTRVRDEGADDSRRPHCSPKARRLAVYLLTSSALANKSILIPFSIFFQTTASSMADRDNSQEPVTQLPYVCSAMAWHC